MIRIGMDTQYATLNMHALFFISSGAQIYWYWESWYTLGAFAKVMQ